MERAHKISEASMQRHKNAKVRLTLLVWLNVSGTEKMSLMVVGQSRKPRTFGKKHGQ